MSVVKTLSVQCSFGKLYWDHHSLPPVTVKDWSSLFISVKSFGSPKKLWLPYNDSSQIFLHPEHHHNVVLQQKLVHKVRVRFTLPAVGCWVGKASGLLLSFLDAVHQE